MCVCSVVSKQNAMKKAIWDSDLIEIKKMHLIYRKLSAAKNNMYVCVVSTWKQSGTVI